MNIIRTSAALAALTLCSIPAHGAAAPRDTAPVTASPIFTEVAMLARGGGGMRGGGGGMRGGGGGFSRSGGGGNFGGGSRDIRSSASGNVNFNNRGNGNFDRNNFDRNNTNFNGNQNFNRNNVNVNNNIHGECYGGCYNRGWDHPVAAAAAVGAVAATTAAVVGSMAYSLPPDCTTPMANGYYQCGDTWYQPQYSGTDVQYEVVNPPQ
jgi:hypothetical protein